MNNIKFVNVFQGVREITKGREGSLYSKWNILKGKAGNTSPSACLPFGSVSCSPYSGGYSAGYGNFTRNGCLPPEKFFEGDKIIGFSHFTHSGSGAFGFYYNYLIVSPYINDWNDSLQLKDFDEEKATPGYYSCRLKEENIKCEVTVADKVALHRYTSNTKDKINISIDISNNGLMQPFDERVFGYSTQTHIYRSQNNEVCGFVTMQGVKIYFCAKCLDENVVTSLWLDGNKLQDGEWQSQETDKRFGCIFETTKSSVDVVIGFSLIGVKEAKQSVEKGLCFDKAVSQAKKAWKKRFNSIKLIGTTDKNKEIFYSNFYHTLVKPCGWKKENFLWNEEDISYLDFATLWDVYKTQMPLIFSLYTDIGRGIVKTLLRFGKEKGNLFNAFMLSSNMNIESSQACCLGAYVLYDAYACGLIYPNEIEDMFAVVKAEVEQYRDSVASNTIEKTTKLLDVCLIADAYAELAKKLGRANDSVYFSDIAQYWTNAFGEDGLLKTNYPYYEGNHWNYSFRFVRDVKTRISLSGGKENLTKQLDAFFAFTDENELINRFEGFNNETDMETPYFYHYVGGYDKLIKIMQVCTSECFSTGRDGLPGNNDSGGLSSCYLWNFLGIYPISGQGQFFVGAPQMRKAVVRLSNGKRLSITVKGAGEQIDGIYFNKEKIPEYTIPVSKILNGGKLVFYKR